MSEDVEIAEIVRLAALMHKVDRDDSDEDATELERGLKQLGGMGSAMVIFAGKMLEGKPYRVISDWPETVARYRSVARHLGASEETTELGIVFRPPAQQ